MKVNNRSHYFGKYGGRFVPEMLIPALSELEDVYNKWKDDKEFLEKLTDLNNSYTGRPTPLYFAENLTKRAKGCKIFLKLESHCHTGAHKINNVLGQILLAKKMGKSCIIAETGAGQHGVATASVAAKFNLKCKVFMGKKDIVRQYPNVYSMKLLGAEVIPVESGTQTLKDAVNDALKYWIENLKDSYYLLGSALGPYPYPLIVRDFQSIIGIEVKKQLKKYDVDKPDFLVACVGGGSNSLGLFSPFLDDKSVNCIGIEAGGESKLPGKNAIRFGGAGSVGIVQGYKSYFIQDDMGQVLPTHSISAGLDYAGVSPELADLFDSKRVQFESINDHEALEAYKILSRDEGIIPALESSHALAYGLKIAGKYSKDRTMVINISGRGDKDLFITAKHIDRNNWINFLKEEASNGE